MIPQLSHRILALVLASGAACVGGCGRTDTSCGDAGPVPVVTGPFIRVFVPPGTRYVNDHTIARGPDGWHLYGITDESEGAPFEENEFLHATADSLLGPWIAQEDALVADGAAGERILWAPHVVPKGDGWAMFYWSDEDDTGRGIRRADSVDLSTWVRAAVNQSARWPSGGRDPFVMRDGDSWLVFSVGVTADSHGQIVLSRSDDLETWTESQPVITDPVASYGWGNLESPFIVAYDGAYYLFITRGLGEPGDYTRTLVFRSSTYDSFEWCPITELVAHAAEIVLDGEQYFITSGGWTSEVGEANRGVLMAPLEWRE